MDIRKTNKPHLLYVLLLATILLLCGCERNSAESDSAVPSVSETLPSEASTPLSNETLPPDTAPAETEVLYDIPEEIRDHWLLSKRGLGSCESMTGHVLVTILLVDDPKSQWSEAEKTQLLTDLETQIQLLLADAALYGAELEITVLPLSVTVDTAYDNHGISHWADSVLASAGMTLDTACKDLENQYGVDHAPIILYLNRNGRDASLSGTNQDETEYAILYNNAYSFRHELSHIFGAKDFYVPAVLEELALEYYSDTLMIDSSQPHIDDFNAFLIGWTDQLTETELDFITQVNLIPDEVYTDGYINNAYTGEVTDFETFYGIYTGHLDMGVPVGEGKMLYYDGRIYEGNFDYGKRTGTGTMTWPDGDTYTGEFLDNQFHGQGTYTQADGSSYTGDYVDGKQSGHGTYIFASGNTYTGDFLDNKFHGHGTFTWTDGSIYVGDFVDDKRTGQGTITWANGASYTGDFVNDKRTGQGTYTWANGASYTGDFVGDKRTGQGTYTWANGASYTGGFLDGERHGYGTYTNFNGNTYTGNWENGEFIG